MVELPLLDPSEAPRARRWDALILGSGISALIAATRIGAVGQRAHGPALHVVGQVQQHVEVGRPALTRHDPLHVVAVNECVDGRQGEQVDTEGQGQQVMAK